MSPDQRDLRDLFAAAGAEERAAADPLDVAALLGRAHRRRTVRGATYSAVGVGTAAAIALGAVSADGLWRDDSQPVLPPASESPTPLPSASPTATASPATAAPLPGPTFEPAWSTCGTVHALDSLQGYDPDGDALWLSTTDVDAEQYPRPVDEPFELTATMNSSSDRGAADVHLTTAYLVAEPTVSDGSGSVVAIASAPVDATASGTLAAGGEGVALPPVSIPFTSCAASPLAGGDGALDRWLDPNGLYLVVVVADVTTADGVTHPVASVVGSVGTAPRATPSESAITMSTTPFRVPADRSTDSTSTEGAESWCGAEAAGSMEPGDVAIATDATGFRDNGQLVVRASLTNAGSGTISGAWLDTLALIVARDGRQVGIAQLTSSLVLPDAWSPGQTLDVELSAGRFTCTFMHGEPWPAGQYQLLLHASIAGPDTHAYDGGELFGGGPFTFTLD